MQTVYSVQVTVVAIHMERHSKWHVLRLLEFLTCVRVSAAVSKAFPPSFDVYAPGTLKSEV